MVKSPICIFFSLLFFSSLVKSEILFEGYYKVLSGGLQIGYEVARYEFDESKKQFKFVTFLKTNDLGGNITESTRATSGKDMEPISFTYTSIVNGVTKTLDGTFEKGKFVGVVQSSGKTEKIIKDLPKGAFLSRLLVYVILRSKDGLKADTKYDYQALAEEDGEISKGVTYIKEASEYKGIKSFKAVNEFKGQKFTSVISEKGEVLETKVPALQLTAELVSHPSKATGELVVPTAILKDLFGDVPAGNINTISKSDKLIEVDGNPSKQKTTPAGKGLQLKKTGTTESAAEPTSPAAEAAAESEKTIVSDSEKPKAATPKKKSKQEKKGK